jgi:hypothetical protein
MKSSAVKAAAPETATTARGRLKRHERNDRQGGQCDEHLSEHETLPEWGRWYERIQSGWPAAQLEASCSRRSPEMQNSVITPGCRPSFRSSATRRNQ